MPAPPFLNPDSPVLRLIVTSAVGALRSGRATAEQAGLHAAVHGWYEGRIQGEGAGPGCDYRGLPKQATRGWLSPDAS